MNEDLALHQAMRAEMAAVLESTAFARSPVLSRLLTYLVEESIAGRAARLKSYTVAVDGLGRESGHDPQLDTYSRVAMVRLRRALDTFYQSRPQGFGQRLNIPFGSYEVVLERTGDDGLAADREIGGQCGSGPEPEGALKRSRSPLRRYRWTVLALVVVAVLIGAQWLYSRSLRETAVWQQANFPSVLVTVGGAAKGSPPDELRDVADAFREAIRPYETVRLAQAMDSDVSYVVNLAVEPSPGSSGTLRVMVTSIKRNRVIYQGSLPFTGRPQEGEGRLALSRTVFAIFGYAGQIESLEARNSMSADSPYDCWLRFSQQLRIDSLYNDAELTECTHTWFEHAPQRPLAVAIHAWTEMNAALLSLTPGSRESKLRETLKLLEDARARYPASRHIQIALARNYGLLGYPDSVREAVEDLRESAGNNPDINNLAGTFMVLQNDPAGEALIDESIAFVPDPPARYFLGKFLAAMMRDDVGDAGKALDRLVLENRTSVWSQLFQAAYLARSGNVPAAKVAWGSVTKDRPALGLSPHLFIANSPASPQVKARMLDWLGPVF